jgi:uncharacterized membrane protein (GlpM family)
MDTKNVLFSFILGGTVTALIVGLEQEGSPMWSGIAALMPVFTMVSYFFVGASQNSRAVSEHSKFVLIGTLVSWVPYMLVIAMTSDRLGTNRSMILAISVFFVLAGGYAAIIEKFHLFQ